MSNSTKMDWKSLVERKEKEDLRKPENVYHFSNGRSFKSTDRGTTGIYKK